MSFRTAPLSVPADPQVKQGLFTPEIRAEIDRHVAKYPPEWKHSAVMPALTLVQDWNGGWLSRELMDQVATYLDMPQVAVYEVATFYGMYDLEPTAKHKVCVCNSISCMLCGSEELIEHVEKTYGVGIGETTADGRFTFKEVECLGACGGAPMMQIGRNYYENLTPELVDQILDGLE